MSSITADSRSVRRSRKLFTRDANSSEQLDVALRLLDRLLALAVERAQREFTPTGALDAIRGLHISGRDVQRALAPTRMSIAPKSTMRELAEFLSAYPEFDRLASYYALDDFERVVLLIAIAPEVDLRYQRIYAYLQDDVTRKRPTIDFVFALLCSTREERIARMACFSVDGALIANQLVELLDDPNYVAPPLLGRYVKPDEQIVQLLLNDTRLDSRLSRCCSISTPHASLNDLLAPDSTLAAIRSAASALADEGSTSCVWVSSPDAAHREQVADAIAHECDRDTLALDANRVAADEFDVVLSRAIRAAALSNRIAHIRLSDANSTNDGVVAHVTNALRTRSCSCIVTASASLPALLLGHARPLMLSSPDRRLREKCWRRELAARNVAATDETIATLANRFFLYMSQIAAAVGDASLRVDGEPGALDLLQAARAQSGHALRHVADRIEPRATWDDIVLPGDVIVQLREICQRVDARDRVFDEWGFGRKLSRGRGTTALFSGGSGTGKTMAAEVIANALGLELYRIDLARVVSKYIGETEKNLQQVFAAAEGANAILFFDEADALFGKRSEVKDAHDRYANIEISYLLQKMEEYDGVAILATNLADNIDEAFARRLAFHIYFPFPDEAARLEIWKRAWPRELPLASSVDKSILARNIKVAGGAIRNIALSAAFAAATSGNAIDIADVLHAIRREHQKSGHESMLPQVLAQFELTRGGTDQS